LFTWRRLVAQGSLIAAGSGQEVGCDREAMSFLALPAASPARMCAT
jgi:hypothetical protein